MQSDLTFALRGFRKSPGFAAVAILTVALGIGAATAIYAVANAVVFRPLPFKDEARLAWIWSTRPDRDRAFFSIPDFLDLQRDATTTAEIAAITPLAFNLTGIGEPERALGWRVTPNLFALLGAEPEIGRLPSANDDRASTAPSAVLGFGYWQRRFGGDPAVVGRVVTLNGSPCTIVGVLPRSFIIPNWDNEIFVAQSLATDPRRGERGTNFLRAIARLKPGVPLAEAQAEFARLNQGLSERFPDTNATVTAPRFVALRDEVIGSYRASLLLLLGASGVLLAIMSANLAGLLAARGLARRRDAALCSALGASPWRLLRMYLTEGLLIAAVGGGLGIALCTYALPVLLRLAPAELPRANQIGFDWAVVAVAAGCTLLTGLGVGLAPAIQLARTAPGDVLKNGSAGATAKAFTRKVLVAAQIALCTALLIGTGLLARSLQRLLDNRPGFESAQVLTVQTLLPATGYREVNEVVRFVDETTRRLGALPGVRSASITSVLPLTGINTRSEFTRGDRAAAKPSDELSAANRFIGEHYFGTVGIPLMAGRDFQPDDDAAHRPVVIIDQALAERHWPGEAPLGKTILIRNGTTPEPRVLEIVGVVGPTKNFTLEETSTPTLYLPYRQMQPGNLSFFLGRINFVLKASGEPMPSRELVRGQIHTLDPNAAVIVRTLDESVAWARAPRIFNLRLLGFFSLTAVLLAVLGLYAITTQAVTARTREICIRLALGAAPGRMTRAIVDEGARVALIGIVVGILVAAATSSLIARMLYGVQRFDLPTYGCVAVLLGAVALVATWLPARRAGRIAPAIALRAE